MFYNVTRSTADGIMLASVPTRRYHAETAEVAAMDYARHLGAIAIRGTARRMFGTVVTLATAHDDVHVLVNPTSADATVLADVETEARPNGNGAVRIRTRIVASDYGTATATVRVTMLPDRAGWWTCPDARTRRRAVDRALRGTGWKRDGSRAMEPYALSDGWLFQYSLTRA